MTLLKFVQAVNSSCRQAQRCGRALSTKRILSHSAPTVTIAFDQRICFSHESHMCNTPRFFSTEEVQTEEDDNLVSALDGFLEKDNYVSGITMIKMEIQRWYH